MENVWRKGLGHLKVYGSAGPHVLGEEERLVAVSWITITQTILRTEIEFVTNFVFIW